jgi:TonB-dependent SusC/RagA subfamily outer membrane receptor
MKRKILLQYILFPVIFISFFAEAQDRFIHGYVTTYDSIPLIGAEIEVKSTKQTVLTDSLGRFSVPVNQKDRLKVSANGFFPRRIRLDENIKIAVINLKMKPGNKKGEYSAGYYHVSYENNVSNIEKLDQSGLDFSHYRNVYDLIEGRFSGVRVVNGEIIIHGEGSLMLSNSALIVVDGFPVDSNELESIRPVDIKNINIIKDGSAAIYGARGANGVVIIETKQGKD